MAVPPRLRLSCHNHATVQWHLICPEFPVPKGHHGSPALFLQGRQHITPTLINWSTLADASGSRSTALPVARATAPRTSNCARARPREIAARQRRQRQVGARSPRGLRIANLAAWQSRLRSGGQSARPYPYATPCLGCTSASACRQQGLPGLPWCDGVPVRRACRTGTVPWRWSSRGSRRRGVNGSPAGTPGCRRARGPGSGMAGLPAGCLRTPGDPGPGGGRQPGIIEQAGVPGGGRTPVNLAVEQAGAVPGRRGTGGCSCPVGRARSCRHAE